MDGSEAVNLARRAAGEPDLTFQVFLAHMVPALQELDLNDQEFAEIMDQAREEAVRRKIEVMDVPTECPSSQAPKLGADHGVSPTLSIALEAMHQDFHQPRAGAEMTPLECLVCKSAQLPPTLEAFRGERERYGGGSGDDISLEELFQRLAPTVNEIENEAQADAVLGVLRLSLIHI